MIKVNDVYSIKLKSDESETIFEFLVFKEGAPELRVSIKWDGCINMIGTDYDGEISHNWLHFCDIAELPKLAEAVTTCSDMAVEMLARAGKACLIQQSPEGATRE